MRRQGSLLVLQEEGAQKVHVHGCASSGTDAEG